MRFWRWIVRNWFSFWGDPHLGGLTEEEYEEFEVLAETRKWRPLSPAEIRRYDQLCSKWGE